MKKLFELKNKLQSKSKGFTLVEIIVVLVILAILAAAVVPTMLGYVEESKGKTYVTSARVVKVSGQSLATERIALGDSAATVQSNLNDTTTPLGQRLVSLSGEDVLNENCTATFEINEDGQISKLVYKAVAGTDKTYVVTIDDTGAASVTVE